MADALEVKPLSRDAFAPFGDVIEFEGRESYPINDGMADRFHALAGVELGGADARAVISLVASRKFDLPRRVDHMEFHPHGSQAFIPLDATPFIVVVSAAGTAPDPDGLHAFVTNGRQGINYHAGTWHHVLLTPYAAMRFVCVDRDSPADNCVDFHIPEPDQPLLVLP
ncbi:MAG: ureidoglycolate lyase [Gammaproteobacteria bacterium]|nr:ureidoglycolate lyase [Gammaproteobacteria bacterium]MDH3534382.1 ureidoglycolate lyase [Gammaproteobacteria bacterium]